MNFQASNQDIEEFIKVTNGSREVGLIIARSTLELENAAHLVESAGFAEVRGIDDLLKNAKHYLLLGKKIDKGIYDFLVQYPTGQVEIFDNQSNKSRLFSPDYSQASVMVLILLEDLLVLEEGGIVLREVAGPAFQFNS